MLTEQEYAEQMVRMGRTVHEHNGVWWDRTYPFYHRPVHEFHAFNPGDARPCWNKSFLGYSHQVSEPAMANRWLEFMLLKKDDLASFGIERLDAKKRNQVRKGLKSCRIEPITDLKPHLEEARQINISQAQRQMATGIFDRPPSYYEDNADEWKKELLSRFDLKGWNWWGAFVQSRLIAYMLTVQVDSCLYILAMKTHTAHLPLCATDAVYFTALDHAARSQSVEVVVNGKPQRDGLNRYKEQFLFRTFSIPYYTFPFLAYRLGVLLVHWREAIRMRKASAHSGNASTKHPDSNMRNTEIISSPLESSGRDSNES